MTQTPRVTGEVLDAIGTDGEHRSHAEEAAAVFQVLETDALEAVGKAEGLGLGRL